MKKIITLSNYKTVGKPHAYYFYKNGKVNEKPILIYVNTGGFNFITMRLSSTGKYFVYTSSNTQSLVIKDIQDYLQNGYKIVAEFDKYPAFGFTKTEVSEKNLLY